MILVTGGLGFVGCNLVMRLLGNGQQVRILDNLGNNAVAVIPGAELVHGDIRRPPDKTWAGVDTVVHLAAVPGVETCANEPVESLGVNVRGTLRLLKAAVEHGVKQFILASSVGAVLGTQQQPANENQVPYPQNVYGWSKMIAEEIAETFSDRIKVCVLRFTNIYGENSSLKESVIARLMRRKPDALFTVYGDGQQTRDFVYVGDVCSAVSAVVERKAEGRYHIGAGYGVSLLDLIAMISQVTGIPVPVQFRVARSGDIRDNYTSTEKAKSVLGWKPSVGLEEGLERTWQWFRSIVDSPDDMRLHIAENRNRMTNAVSGKSSGG